MALRRALGTWTDESPPPDTALAPIVLQPLFMDEHDGEAAGPQLAHHLPDGPLARIAANLDGDLQDRLLLGFPQGPFVLVLQPDEPEAFDEFLRKRHGDVQVHIRYASSEGGASGEWAITPLPERQELVVRFGIPPLLDSWLLAAGPAEVQRARMAKRTLLSTIGIFRGNRLIRLRYAKLPRTEPVTDAALREEVPHLRLELADPRLAFTPDRRERRFAFDQDSAVPPVYLPSWTVQGIKALLDRLEADEYFQAKVIRAAAHQGGSITREQVYALGALDPSRTLKGFSPAYNPYNTATSTRRSSRTRNRTAGKDRTSRRGYLNDA